MTDSLVKLKVQVHCALVKSLDQKIALSNEDLRELEESRNTNDKSTAGDKHETGRAMAQIELENASRQLSNQLRLRGELKKINPEKPTQKVAPGSLVKTRSGLYFLAIGIGKVTIESSDVFAISIDSPIGKAMFGKAKGETFEFRGEEFTLLNIA